MIEDNLNLIVDYDKIIPFKNYVPKNKHMDDIEEN